MGGYALPFWVFKRFILGTHDQTSHDVDGHILCMSYDTFGWRAALYARR